MVTETFFDLQRFADDTLKGDGEKFVWAGGASFAGDGTQASPVQMVAAGTSGATASVEGTSLYITGTEEGYSFAIEEVKNDWEISKITDDAVVKGDFSTKDGVYELDGAVDVKVIGGSTEGFTESVNGQSVAIKATGSDAVTFNIEAENSSDDSFVYTFANGTKGAMVDLDDDDTAIFAGAATNITFSEDSNAVVFGFSQSAIVTGEGNDLTILTGDNVITENDETTTIDADGVATVSSNGYEGVNSVAIDTKEGFDETITVNGKEFDKISGDITGIKFEVVDGEVMAHVKNTGNVTVEAEEGTNVAFDKITTANTVVNGATITGIEAGENFAVELAGASAGIQSIAFDENDPYVKVAGDNSFKVINGSASYTLETTADDITFDGNASQVLVEVQDGKEYTVDGVDGSYTFETAIKKGERGLVTINDADVTVNNSNDPNAFVITSEDDADGIEKAYLVAGDAINVAGDDDGYTAIFTSNGSGSVATLDANGYKIAVDDDDLSGNVTMAVAATDDAGVYVKGLKDAVVTLSGGGTYYFKDESADNQVKAYNGEELAVTLDSAGNVKDVMDAATEAKLANDDAKWDEIATLGSSDDTVKTNKGKVYDAFYDLANSDVANQSSAGYDYDDDTTPVTVSGAINITGEGVNGADANLGEAGHVTLEVGSGTYVGKVPINIEENENANVVDVTIDMTKTNTPSTVAVGTNGTVSATHKVYLSNSSTAAKPSYGYIGSGATGNNLLQAGGAAMLRHDGDAATSIFGGSGNDTILAGKNDNVQGGEGADLYYDSASYAIQDYSAADGDAIIATRLSSLSEVQANVSGTGNKVKFGNGKEIAIANSDANDALHVKVAVMDNDANVLKDRMDVVLANGNGVVDASAAGSNGALILAGAARGDGVHTVRGSAGNDVIYAGSNDSINAGAGDDYISLDAGASGAVVAFGTGSGKDTVANWQFGFDKSDGATQLDLDGTNFAANIIEDQIVVSVGSGNALTFAGTEKAKDDTYQILIDETKYTVMRTGKTAVVDSNDAIANIYWAQADGAVSFTSDVTKDLGMIDLNSENYQNIHDLYLYNNSKASVMGTDEQDTVWLGGAASVGAGKSVSLDAGNDVIYSGGDAGASNTLYFGAGDGRDSLYNFNHYSGKAEDPQHQHSDLLIVDNFVDVSVATAANGLDRITFKTSDQDEIAIYETTPLDYNNNMYRVKINGFDETVAKIGYSAGGNNFTYNDEVQYYVGASGSAKDTLTIGDDAINTEVWLDSAHDGKFYRGIGVVDASAATGTNISIAGSMDNNTIYGGGSDSKSTLWGGAGDNLLVGGNGDDVFMYYQYSRNYIDGAANMAEANHDTIRGYDSENDTIFLGDITIDEINFEATSIGDNSVTVTMNNGGTLTIEGTQETTRIALSNGDSDYGQVWSAARSTKTWTREA